MVVLALETMNINNNEDNNNDDGDDDDKNKIVKKNMFLFVFSCLR